MIDIHLFFIFSTRYDNKVSFAGEVIKNQSRNEELHSNLLTHLVHRIRLL